MYHFTPLNSINARVTGKGDLTRAQVKEKLKPFHVICLDETFCRTPIERELVMFHSEQGKIGTQDFNIPTTLTLEAESDEIKKELEAFYTAFARKGSYAKN